MSVNNSMGLLDLETAQSVFAHNQEFIFYKDLQSRYIGANKFAVKMLGLKSENKLIGLRDQDCCYAEFTEHYVANDKLAINKQKTQYFLELLRLCGHNKNQTFVAFSQKIPLVDKDKNIIGVLGKSVPTTISAARELFCTIEETELEKAASAIPIVTHFHQVVTCPVTLTEAEEVCLFYVLRGKSAPQIGELMNRSKRTIEDQINRLKSKFNCNSKSALIEKAIDLGLSKLIPRVILDNQLLN